MSRKIVPTLAGQTVRCILFDLGSTLWIYEDSPEQRMLESAAEQRAVAVLRQHIPSHYFSDRDETVLKEQIAQAVGQRTHEMYLQNTNLEPDFVTATLEGLERIGFPLVDRTVGAEIFEALRTRSFGTRTLFEDALTTLATLQQRGFLLGVVTNRQYGGPLFIEDMRNFGLLDYFEEPHIAISADLKVRKPNPVIFRHALDALNVPPEDAVMVGDSLGADIVGAKQLNMAAVWKPNPHVFAQVRAAQENEQTTQTFEQLLFDFGQRYERMRGRTMPSDLAPNLIIEHLRELLDVFVKVGKQ
ncbi:MAG: hypothetical protein NVS4B11_22750 [Ktedonobacteraceae bacterium]